MPDTEWTYQDGSKVTLHEDGSVTVTETDGTQTHVDDDTGRRTVTPPNPPGGPPVVDNPPVVPVGGGDKTFAFPDGIRYKFKKGPPPRFQRIKAVGAPRTIEIDLSNGNRRTVPTPGADEVHEQSASHRTIEPSTHPKPPDPPPPTPTPGGGHKPSLKKKSRRRPKAKPKKAVGRKKRR